MEKIIKYFTETKKMTSIVASVLAKPLAKYEDIKSEFCDWIDNNTYEFSNPVVINGYSAKDIHEMAPQLDGAGVYNFMVTLRDAPEKAQKCIENGFAIK